MTDSKVGDPLVRVSYADIAESKKNEPHVETTLVSELHRKRRTPSWRKTVAVGITTTSLVLLINVGALAWVCHKYDDEHGIATVYEGSCQVSRKVAAYVDLSINILSTLLLGVSNNCAQLLSAPTREEVDAAHNKGKWLDIGVASVRNLGVVPGWRILLWAVLFLSSLPLHLLYNSAIFTTLSANDYQAALVTEDFLHGAWWNQSKAQHFYPAPNIGQLQAIQDDVHQLQRLDNRDCIQAYGSSTTETQWRNVLLVTSFKQNDSLLAVYAHSPDSDYGTDPGWLCDGGYDYYYSPTGASCNINGLIAGADSWTLYNVALDYCPNVTLADGEFRYDGPCNNVTAPIEYCLAEPFPSHCTVRVSTSILTTVIVCNVLKIICMVTAIASQFVPLANLGDAISSFLDQQDQNLKGRGPLSVNDIKQGAQKLSPTTEGSQHRPFQRKSRLWGRAVGVTRWFICIVLCCIAWATALALFFEGKSSQLYGNGIGSFSSLEGSGTIDVGSLVGISEGSPIIANVLFANLPQMAISLVYVLNNNVLTCMLLAHEWASFATKRKALRTTQPQGQQRSTYWLQLPYRYILPLMGTMAVLYWLISRSIFLVQLDIYDNNGILVPGRRINACGYSLPAIVLALAVGGALILALIICSFRRLEAGIPVVGSCSLAISAACSNDQGQGSSLKPLQYGVLTSRSPDVDGTQFVGFTCAEVAPLVSGVVYR